MGEITTLTDTLNDVIFHKMLAADVGKVNVAAPKFPSPA